MKRLGSSDSLGGLVTICPTTDKRSRDQFQSILDGLDDDGCVEESGHIGEKKRRLSVTQVKALEKNFELENKLEPERKVNLAHELGLQPRQVAVWFQNRRARWKTKQLERDYNILKANYEALKLKFDTFQRNNDDMRKEIRELKSKFEEDNNTVTVTDISVKKDVTLQGSENRVVEQSNPTSENPIQNSESKDLSHECFNGYFKDGASDSDSSAILNEDNSPNATTSSSGFLQSNQLPVSPSPPSSGNCFQFHKVYQPQFVKMEEHDFLGGDDTCDFFSDEQAPTLHWYCSDQWN